MELVTLYTNSKELVELQDIDCEGGKKDVCKAIRDLMEDSREEGREESKLEVAKNLLRVISDELIAEKVGLPLEKVKELYTTV